MKNFTPVHKKTGDRKVPISRQKVLYDTPLLQLAEHQRERTACLLVLLPVADELISLSGYHLSESVGGDFSLLLHLLGKSGSFELRIVS